MEVSGSFHGNASKFPQSVEVEPSMASIKCGFHEYIPRKLLWASTYLYILPPTSMSIANFQLLAQDFHKGPPSSTRSTSMEVSTNVRGQFHGNKSASMEVNLFPWKLPWKTVEIYLLPWKYPWKLVEADLLPWKLVEASMQVDLLPWKLVEASVEVHVSFRCR